MMEHSLLSAVVIIASGSALMRFALFEWEGIADAWSRVFNNRRRNSAPKTVRSRAGRQVEKTRQGGPL